MNESYKMYPGKGQVETVLVPEQFAKPLYLKDLRRGQIGVRTLTSGVDQYILCTGDLREEIYVDLIDSVYLTDPHTRNFIIDEILPAGSKLTFITK